MSSLLHCLTIFIIPISKLILRRSKEPEKTTECAVCLSEICNGDETNDELRCKHVFHKCCLERWVENRGRTCPLCRDQLSVKSVKKSEVEVEYFRRWRGETTIVFSAFSGFGLEDNWWVTYIG